MRKISKLLVMAFVVLAVITLSVNVSASTNTLKEYVGGVHEINGMEFKLSTKQKETVLNYISGLDDATSKAIYDDIISIENIIKESKVTKLADLSDADRSKAFNIAKSAAEKAGLTLTVNTKTQTFTLKKIRMQANLTQEQLAKITKLSIRYISLLETGRRNPSDKTKMLLAKALKVSPVDIFLAFNRTRRSKKRRII